MKTSGKCAWLILVCIALLAECALADVLTTKGGSQYEGTVTEDEDNYIVVKPDGGKAILPKSMVSRVEKGSLPASQTVNPTTPGPTPGPAIKPDAGPKGRSTVDISRLTGAKNAPAGGEKLVERVVTGVGTDPEKALQAAFSQAIESAVGLLVDAETVVKNDQIIKDQVLTYSRGFVQKYDVVKQWQADGLHHATIKAIVETGKLTDKLKANNIATHEIAGELIARQIRFDFKNEAEAAEMLKKVLDGFDMTKLAKVEIDGKPDFARDGASVKMSIPVKISPDLDEWQKFSTCTRTLLEKTSDHRSMVTVNGSALGGNYLVSPKAADLKNQLAGSGILVCLYVSMKNNAAMSQWEVFRIPGVMESPLAETAAKMKYRVVCILLDKDGKEVLRSGKLLDEHCGGTQIVGKHGPMNVRGEIGPIHTHHGWDACGDRGDCWWIAPNWWDTCCIPLQRIENTITLSQEDIAKVAKVTVVLERAKGKD